LITIVNFKFFLITYDSLNLVIVMKIQANDYKANEVMKIIREWTTLSQQKFAKEVGRSRNSINNIENDRNRIFLNDFLDICDKFDIVVTLEKKK
jgi:DNA-binding XRE family transcriptional regulator